MKVLLGNPDRVGAVAVAFGHDANWQPSYGVFQFACYNLSGDHCDPQKPIDFSEYGRGFCYSLDELEDFANRLLEGVREFRTGQHLPPGVKEMLERRDVR